ncbi:MAG: type VI secretion system protein TssA [Gammaproteobacteria bacterium]|nr:type VI secretion system protein TssA [Gammaproteobacteria bacterium]MDH3431650.1 type VI secretion system protein TssA [Gammaproteobacteria bacterium]
MSVIDVDQLVAPLAEDSPSGENLEYEPEFGELERTAQGTDEHVMGDEVVAAQEPDWSAVLEQAQELLGRTKDLRIAVLLARAALNRHGPAGLADGTAVIRGLLEQQWETVHPQLDAEDNDDPTFRVNSVLPLGDKNGILRDLLKMTLVSSKAVGRFSLRDIRVANGDLQPLKDQESVPDAALINAAFMDCDLEELQSDAAHIDEALENIGKSEAIFAENVGAAFSPDLSDLVADLKVLQNVYAENLRARGIGVEAPQGAEVGGEGGGAAPISGEVNSREDAIRMIDKVCLYYERNEPSSPVPMLLQRAKRLVSKDFLEVIRDLTPDAVAQAELMGGITHEDEY